MKKYFPNNSTNAILKDPSRNENVSEKIRILCQRNTNDAFWNEGVGAPMLGLDTGVIPTAKERYNIKNGRPWESCTVPTSATHEVAPPLVRNPRNVATLIISN